METLPKVFVIILNYNGKGVLLDGLRSLLKVKYSNFETVLVDNASGDDSLEEARRAFPGMTIIKNSQNLGFAAGNNVGIKYALERGADYVLLLNNDTLAMPDFLETLVEAVQKDPKIGLASPVVLDGEEKIWFSGGKIDWLGMKAIPCRKDIKKNNSRSAFLSGCALLVKKEVFKKIGLLDEDYFLYYEDTDFSVRARRAGFKTIVVAGSRIIHLEKSEENKNGKIYWLVLSGLIFFRKNSPFWLRPWLFFYVLARRVKNWYDMKNNRGETALSVGKAYADFRRAR